MNLQLPASFSNRSRSTIAFTSFVLRVDKIFGVIGKLSYPEFVALWTYAGHYKNQLWAKYKH